MFQGLNSLTISANSDIKHQSLAQFLDFVFIHSLLINLQQLGKKEASYFIIKKSSSLSESNSKFSLGSLLHIWRFIIALLSHLEIH